MNAILLELAYKLEVLATRCQGIASDYPRWNGEYGVVARLGSRIRHAVDGGANLGAWTHNLLRYSPDARVLLVEPHPRNAEHLRSIFAARSGQIIVHEMALGSDTRHVYLSADGALGTGSGVTTPQQPECGWRVPTASLSEVVSAFGPHCDIDFVKLDIEGDEMTVLRAAASLFSQGRLGIVQVEYNCTWLQKGEWLRDLFAFANHHDYALLQLTPLGPMSLSAYGVGLEDYRMRNILLVRADMVRALKPLSPAGRVRAETVRRTQQL